MAIADTLGVSCTKLIERLKGKSMPRGPYHEVEDAELLPSIRRLVASRRSLAPTRTECQGHSSKP
jgi:hypothetical protein